MNKVSVFVVYSLLSLVGFGGVALLGFTGKSNDLNAIIAFFSFYGFLCTTGVFYVVGKMKAAMEWQDERINDTTRMHTEAVREIYTYIDGEARQINGRVDDAQDSLSREISSVWSEMESHTTSSKR
jgi:hypothetical protein